MTKIHRLLALFCITSNNSSVTKVVDILDVSKFLQKKISPIKFLGLNSFYLESIFFFHGNGFFQRSKKTPALPPSVTDRKRHMGTCWGTREWLRSNCSRPLYQMPIPCRNTSCKPKRWNANVLGTAPRRLTPPTASRKPHSSISGSSSNPAKRRTSPFQTSPGSSPNRSRFFSRRSWDAGTGTWIIACAGPTGSYISL